jgi:hypothetical protein
MCCSQNIENLDTTTILIEYEASSGRFWKRLLLISQNDYLQQNIRGRRRVLLSPNLKMSFDFFRKQRTVKKKLRDVLAKRLVLWITFPSPCNQIEDLSIKSVFEFKYVGATFYT